MKGLKNLELTRNQKGILSIILGIVVLLYAFNFFQAWLNTIVIIAGLFLIGYGLHKVGGIEKIKEILSNKK